MLDVQAQLDDLADSFVAACKAHLPLWASGTPDADLAIAEAIRSFSRGVVRIIQSSIDDSLVGLDGAALRLGVSRDLVGRLADRGELRDVRVEHRRMITASSIDDFIKRGGTGR